MSVGRSPSSSISSSSQSRLSFVSSSSSTFSDVSVVSSLPSPPPTGALKTHAFFASPFATSPTPTPSFTIPSIDISTPTLSNEDYSCEPTPRPKQLEPNLSTLWSLGIESDDDDDPDNTEPTAGSIISPPLEQPKPATALRLLKPLGHGAFSSVWLAYDLSPDPLVLRSRRSLRHLRRQASAKLTNGAISLSISRAGSLRKLSKRVPGIRPIRSLDHDRLNPSLSRASSNSSSDSQPRKLSISISDPRPPPLQLSLSSLADADTASSSDSGASSSHVTKGRLVAVKMTARGGGANQDRETERTRVAFVREVEVLRHISHPNITPLLSHLSTETHHVLVLPYLPGGDLLALVNTDTAWYKLRESVLQRIWTELCSAVAWMHSVGIVHRDIKLENILLTTPMYTLLTPEDPAPTLADLPQTPAPLVKLTDFGLSRFVDIRSWEERMRDRNARRRARKMKDRDGPDKDDEIDNDDEEEEEEEEEEEDSGPLLSTRCGSEAYAAPELVMGGSTRTLTPPPARVPTPALPPYHHHHGGFHHNHDRFCSPASENETETLESKLKRSPGSGSRGWERGRAHIQRTGVYDARETDAWACGIVLYALVARKLPFGEGSGGGEGRIGRELLSDGGMGARMARRAWLMRIAKGEYEWPEVVLGSSYRPKSVGGVAPVSGVDLSFTSSSTPTSLSDAIEDTGGMEDKELMGPDLALSEGARRIVGKLLVRDPRKRAKMEHLWGDVWMGGGGDGETVISEDHDDDDNDNDNDNDDYDDDRMHKWIKSEALEAKCEHLDVWGVRQEMREEEGELTAANLPGMTTIMSEEELERALEEAVSEVDEFGCLVDQDGIDDIARREVL